MQHDIVVHVWSDIACPWCYIGKHRLEKGIELSGQKVAVEYHAYQLEPNAPTSPTSTSAERLAKIKKLDLTTTNYMLEHITKVAADEGLTMNWDQVQPVNSFLALQLVYAAKASGNTPEEAALAGGRMVERLYQAYFTEGRNLSDTDTLVDIAEEMGLIADDVHDQIESGEYADDVRNDVRDAESLGIKGVPFYIVAGRLGLSGAQEPQVFADAINRAIAEMQAEPEGWRENLS